MEMVRAIILEGEIDDIFWPEIILAITYIKNLQSIYTLKDNISLVEI